MTVSQEQTDPHAKRVRRRKSTGPASMQLNLTSMIDVIFLLLIYFVITASFTPDEGIITSKLPAQKGMGAQSTLEPPKRPLDIVVSDVGNYEYRLMIEQVRDRTPRDFAHLAQILGELRHDDDNPGGIYPDDTPVLIKPDRGTAWQHVVNAFNAAITAKYTNVSFSRVETQSP